MKRFFALLLVFSLLAVALSFVGVFAQEAPSVDIISQNVWIGEKMHLMYAVYSESLPDGATVSLEIATNAEGNDAVEATYYGQETVRGKVCDVFISKTGVAPQNIQRTFYAKAIVTRNSVTVASSEMKAYSVLQYLFERLYISDPTTVTTVQRDMYLSLLDFASKADLALNNGANNIGSYACVTVSGCVETLPYLYQAGDVIKATANITASGDKAVVWMVRDADTGEVIDKISLADMQSAGYTVEAQTNVTITAEECERSWKLVTDVSELKVGEKIIIATVDYSYALSTTQNENNRGQAAIVKNGDIATIDSDVQIITLEAGAVDGTFAFNVGDGETDSYLYCASTSGKNYMRSQDAIDENASWAITVTDGVASIVAQKTGSNRTILKYNTSSGIFNCYSSGQLDVCIYIYS